jgi:hypothetical protein
MGVFDFLGRKPKEAAPEPPAVARPHAPQAPDPSLSPWQQSLWQAEHSPGFAWEDGNGAARGFVRLLLKRASSAFGDGPVVNGEPAELFTPAAIVISRFGGGLVHNEDTNPELHGTWEGIPVRIPVSIPARMFWAIEMRCQERARFFTILRDPTRIPRVHAPRDAWAKSEQGCVFLGKGIFLDDSDPDTTRDWLVPHWASVPAPAQELVIREMERLDLRCFALSNSHMTLQVLGNRRLHQLDDPLAYLASCAALMAGFARALEASPGSGVPLSSRAAAPERVTCRYCSSLFILAAGKNTCPNCGAPAS